MKTIYQFLWLLWIIINYPILQYVVFLKFISREIIRDDKPEIYKKLMHIEKLKKEI